VDGEPDVFTADLLVPVSLGHGSTELSQFSYASLDAFEAGPALGHDSGYGLVVPGDHDLFARHHSVEELTEVKLGLECSDRGHDALRIDWLLINLS